jgi:hypothetical protein
LRRVGFCGSCGGASGFSTAFTQLDAARVRQRADHSETMNRWAGRLQEVSGWNMWSWSTKFRAYAQ